MTFSLTIRSAAQIAADQLADAKAAATAEMMAMLEAAASAITAGIPAYEMTSWAGKEAAGRAYLASAATAADLVLLNGEAAVTGETVADLAALWVARADAARAAVGPLTGLRRTTWAAIDAATDQAGIDAALSALAAALAP